jgi:Uma2 family endonuclease
MPHPAPAPIKMTVEEFEVFAAQHGRCELINGEVYTMSPAGANHGEITGALHAFLGHHVVTQGLGRIYAAETGFRAADTDVVRAPDIAFIQLARLPERGPGFIEVMPDLVVETVSPNDSVTKVTEKTNWWLDQPGVQLVWVVDPDAKQVSAHRPDGTARIYRAKDVLDGEPVLTGFELELTKLFD